MTVLIPVSLDTVTCAVEALEASDDSKCRDVASQLRDAIGAACDASLDDASVKLGARQSVRKDGQRREVVEETVGVSALLPERLAELACWQAAERERLASQQSKELADFDAQV